MEMTGEVTAAETRIYYLFFLPLHTGSQRMPSRSLVGWEDGGGLAGASGSGSAGLQNPEGPGLQGWSLAAWYLLLGDRQGRRWLRVGVGKACGWGVLPRNGLHLKCVFLEEPFATLKNWQGASLQPANFLGNQHIIKHRNQEACLTGCPCLPPGFSLSHATSLPDLLLVQAPHSFPASPRPPAQPHSGMNFGP